MMSELTHGARSFFFWECRLFWATQQVLLVIAALLVGDVVGNPLAVAVIPAIICGVIAARELRMGLLLPADGSAVVIRRVFSDVTLDLDSVDRLVLNDGLALTGMWGTGWDRSSAALVLTSGEVLWVNGSEGRPDRVKRLVREFNSALRTAQKRRS